MKDMKASLKFWMPTLLSCLTTLALGLSAQAAESDEVKACLEFSNYGEALNVQVSAETHSSAIVGFELDPENMRRDILELSGRAKTAEGSVIDDRFSRGGRAQYRTVIHRHLQDLQIPFYEEVIPEPTFIKKGPEPIAVNKEIDGALDFERASDEFLEKFWHSDEYMAYKLFLNRFLGFQEPSDLRKFSYKIAAQIHTFRKDQKKMKSFPGIAVNSVKMSMGVDQWNALLIDATRILSKMKMGKMAEKQARQQQSREEVTQAPSDQSGLPYAVNVIGEIRGTVHPEKVIEVTAHYDTTGVGKPGADDNGSGLATLYEMMRIFKKYPPKSTIRFVFMDLEERGCVGSKYHAQQLLKEKENILGVLVVDTIGYHPLRASGEKPVFVVELATSRDYPNASDYKRAVQMTDVMAWQNARYHRYTEMSVETDGALPDTADHGSFIRAGIPAVLVAAPYEGDFVNPGYHKMSDVIENYNWLYFTEIAKMLVETVATISGVHLSPAQIAQISPDIVSHINEVSQQADLNQHHRSTVKNKSGSKPSCGVGFSGAAGSSFDSDYYSRYYDEYGGCD
jgi:hypothetical protein